jgi:xylan 1,4-beta-xylosidase
MSTLVRVGEQSRYSFFNADQIFDFLLSIGIKPFVELSFMPNALASGTTTVFHYRGNVTPPRDYGEWEALIRALASHLVDRYGIDEVGQWYFEVWNEPNLTRFWAGDQDQYFRLYRHAAIALKSVHPSLRVGGPATAANAWIGEFLDFCEANQLPVDFVSTHHYPNDGCGNEDDPPEVQLAQSHRSALREQIAATHRQSGGKPLFYTEWNTSANSRDRLHDEPYAAAFIVKTVLEASSLVQSYGFWTFSDIFEEDGLPSRPFHGGFGLLSLHGIRKPSYRAFELLHALGSDRLDVTGVHAPSTPGGSRCGRRGAGWSSRCRTMLIAIEPVQVTLTDAPTPASATIQRIDAQHASAKRLWQEMGEPEYPNPAALAQLHDASRLQQEPQSWRNDDRTIALDIMLPPHAVAVVTLRFATPWL